jgi:calcineurin-like phosphoesterase family protein
VTTFFTSDTHFGHKMMARRRGFGSDGDSTVQMDEELVTRWNEVVGADDEVFHLGDLSFKGTEYTNWVVGQLNGHKHWILGNHDSERMVKKVGACFESVEHYRELKIDDQLVVLFHYPLLTWNQAHHGSWHLHGHSHQNLRVVNGPRIDVGTDNRMAFLTPLSWIDVQALCRAAGEYVPVDHHDEND